MVDRRTEVLSLDELMDLAAEPSSSAPTVQIRRPEAATRPATPTPTPAPAHLNPAAPKPAPATQPPVAIASRLEPLREEARKFLVTAQQWLRRGDNGLIAGTALVALLLIVVVASL